MRRIKRRNSIDEPQINLTPLIDVVFVILIMFIVIAPLLELDRIKLADSKGQYLNGAHAVQEASNISIHVREDNTILFAGKTVELEQLNMLLTKLKKNYPNVRPQLFHDKRAHFGTYQTIKNALERAGFSELDVVLKPS